MRTLFINLDNPHHQHNTDEEDDDHHHSENISYLDFVIFVVCLSLLIAIVFCIRIINKKYNAQIAIDQNTNTIELPYQTYNTTTQYQPEQCIICISDFKPNEQLSTLECGHSYHHECIKEWYKKNQACPICK